MINRETNLQNIEQKFKNDKKVEYGRSYNIPDTVNPVIVVVKAITINKMKSAYSLQEFRNKEGNTIVSY